MNKETPAKTPLLSAEFESSDDAPPTPVPAPASSAPTSTPAPNPPQLEMETKKSKSASSMGAMSVDISKGESKISNEADGGGGDGDAAVREKKQGHKYFFICCDTKRAVIFLNTALLLLNLFTFTAAIVQVDPETRGFYRAVVVRACGMFVTLSTLMGAYWYSRSVVMVGLIFTCYQLSVAIIKVVRYDWDGGYNEQGKLQVLFPVIYQTLVFYADAVFISEVGDGIMTPETYQRREKYSCCCNC